MPHIDVRRATPNDFEAVIELLRLMHREAPAGSYDDGRVRETVQQVLGTGWIFVTEIRGVLAGTLALQCLQWWWSTDWHLTDRWLFVHPDHRNAPHARLLIARAKRLAAEGGVPLAMGLFSDRRLPGKVGMMQRELGAPVGALFLFNPPKGS